MPRLSKTRPHILRASGWTKESLAAAELKQCGCCAICGRLSKSLVGDHAHTNPPIPRGLLCRTCNSGLGFFGDNPKLLFVAAEYLTMYKPEPLSRLTLSKHGDYMEDADGVRVHD